MNGFAELSEQDKRFIKRMRQVVVGFCLFVTIAAPCTALGAPKAELWSFWQQPVAATEAPEHSAWGEFLKKYLVVGGPVNLVRYSAVTPADRRLLDDYIAMLAERDPRGLPPAVQMAYWINLYNALTVQVVLDYPKKKSILRMGRRWLAIGPWDDKLVTIAGEQVTLNDIEHRILRPIFKDHRIHYAVNCASLGCPDLAMEPFSADRLEAQLATAEVRFLSATRAVDLSRSGQVQLSSIYDWYQSDFGDSEDGLLAHLAERHEALRSALAANPDLRVRYDYDWDLNQAPE